MKHQKWIALLTGSLLWLGMLLPAQAANFTDMDKVPWAGAATYINQVADAGLMVGDTTLSGVKVFRPTDSITYCETTQLVYKLLSKYYGTEATAAIQSKYATVLSSFGIPSWAQPACAYCLENQSLQSSDLSYFMKDVSQGISYEAQREKVALIFGRALSALAGGSTASTSSFQDAASISAEVVPYLNVLVKIGIISGDNNGNFNPKNPINRSEMAVMVSKTYDYLNTSVQGSITGTIKSITASGNGTQVVIQSSNDTKTLFGSSSVSCIQDGKTFAFSALAVGDSVMVSYKGSAISSVLRIASASASTGNTVSGTYVGMNNSVINVNTNGTSMTYHMASDMTFILGGQTSNLNAMLTTAEYGDKITLTLNSNGEITKAALSFYNSNNYDVKGYYTGISSSYISLKKSKSSSSATKYYFDSNNSDNVSFYIDGKSSTYSNFKNKVKTGSTVTLVYNSDDKVVEANLQSTDYDIEGYYSTVSNSYINLKESKSSSSSTKYYFADEDYESVTFYVDDNESTYSKFKSYVSSGNKIGLMMNKDDEVVDVYIIDESEEYDLEGYFSSISTTYLSIRENKSDDSATKYYFDDKNADNASFYFDETTTSYSKFKNKAESGDKIGLMLDDDDHITEVYLLEGEVDEEGYFYTVEETYIKITSSRSSNSATKYTFEDDDYDNVDFYIDGVSKTFAKFESAAQDGNKIGLVLNNDDEVTKVYLTSSDEEYDESGYFYSMDKEYIRVATTKYGSENKKYYFEDNDYDNVEFYIDGTSKTFSKFDSAAEEGARVNLVLNDDDEVIEVYLTNDDDDYDQEGYFYSISEEYIRITSSKSSDNYKTYYFEDDDYDNVKFYIDDSTVTYSKFRNNVDEYDEIGLIMEDDEVTHVYLLD